MKLWHVSDRAGIARFEPRAVETHFRQDPLVWAIDDAHVPAYWFPRDLPRATFWAAAGTSDEDVERYLHGDRSLRVHVIQRDWLEEMRAARLYAYLLPPETFELQDATAGYYVSPVAVEPLAVEELFDLERLHADAGIDLRVTDDLRSLWSGVVESTLAFSGIRLRNLDSGSARRT
jgi:hypothetical protein